MGSYENTLCSHIVPLNFGNPLVVGYVVTLLLLFKQGKEHVSMLAANTK